MPRVPVHTVDDAPAEQLLRDESSLDERTRQAIRRMTNYFNHLVGTDLDLPEAPALD